MNKALKIVLAIGLALVSIAFAIIVGVEIVSIIKDEPAVGSSAPAYPNLTDKEKDSIYLEVVREDLPAIAMLNDATLVSWAHESCSLLDTGQSPQQVIQRFLDAGFDPTTSGGLVGAAVPIYCPQHTSKFRR